MAFWDDWQKNKNVKWSEDYQRRGPEKVVKPNTPTSEELSLAKANRKIANKEKLTENMQYTLRKVVKNMIEAGNATSRFNMNTPKNLRAVNEKAIKARNHEAFVESVAKFAKDLTGKDIDPTKEGSFNEFVDAAIKKAAAAEAAEASASSNKAGSNSYTVTRKVHRPFPGREYAHKTVNLDDGSTTISYGPTPDPKDATDFGGKTSVKPEPKTKPTVDSTVKEAAKSKEGAKNSSTLPNEAPRVDGKGATKPDERGKAFTESFSKEMSNKHFDETNAKPTSESTTKNSVWNKLKNSKAGNWLKNTKVGSYFTDSPLTPHNVALTYKGWTGQANPVAYAASAYGMGSGGGYMPVGEHTVDQLRIQHGKDELSNQGTTVPINPQGTQYLDPTLGIVDTQVLKDEDGIRYYRNAQTGQFEPLDSGAPFRYSSIPVEQTPFPKFRTFNIGDDTDYSIDSDANKPLPPMSADEGEIPSGTVEVGPDKEVSAQPVQTSQSAQSVNKPNVASVVKPPRRAPKPKPYVEPAVINNTPTSNVSAPVAAPTLSSVTSQAVRHNGGFDNYRRESVLSALRAAGGISPAEAVQRGIIPWEALNYI